MHIRRAGATNGNRSFLATEEYFLALVLEVALQLRPMR